MNRREPLEDRDPTLVFRTSYGYDPLDRGVYSTFNQWRESGKLGFLDLPGNGELYRSTAELASVMSSRADTMVVCGIGGSSLGLCALLEAFTDSFGSRKVIVADSPDSHLAEEIKEYLDPCRTALTVVTKSGGTAETMSLFLSFFDWIRKSPDWKNRIIAVTDPDKGDLRKLAEAECWSSLPVPPNVGGRFSVNSPVGLFPAIFAGIDAEDVLGGAAAVLQEFESSGEDSLAGRIAAAFVRNFFEYPIHPFFVYSSRLYSTAHWFAQLWAESLGKKLDRSGDTVNYGQTPLACKGPADQHSLVQLFMEGPSDKTVTILTVPPSKDASGLSGGFQEYSSLAYLEGRTLDQLRNAEAEATGKALEEIGTPVSYMEMKALDERSLGELFMALEIATVLAGISIGVEPMDQPGVERGKVLTYMAMGRPGYRT
ncbi:MAG: glucose-6-phosphate isomerase [Candidatus Aegiribacteria sp.]|nr:glucose-6-phosphate isomerase [Candidatus Aegiribacteria sp.]MBD3294285.1 glucose-6-phosphate isomerase [Candidatus Fermentibacteria bacterium]